MWNAAWLQLVQVPHEHACGSDGWTIQFSYPDSLEGRDVELANQLRRCESKIELPRLSFCNQSTFLATMLSQLSWSGFARNENLAWRQPRECCVRIARGRDDEPQFAGRYIHRCNSHRI